MPTYEYACRECGHRFDTVQSFTDDPLTVCPSCGGELRKVFSAAGIIFKGSGYYVTDSRAAAASAGNGAKKGDSADTPGSSSDTPSAGANGEKSAPAKSGTDASGTASPKKTSGDTAASSKSS